MDALITPKAGYYVLTKVRTPHVPKDLLERAMALSEDNGDDDFDDGDDGDDSDDDDDDDDGGDGDGGDDASDGDDGDDGEKTDEADDDEADDGDDGDGDGVIIHIPRPKKRQKMTADLAGVRRELEAKHSLEMARKELEMARKEREFEAKQHLIKMQHKANLAVQKAEFANLDRERLIAARTQLPAPAPAPPAPSAPPAATASFEKEKEWVDMLREQQELIAKQAEEAMNKPNKP